MHKYLVAYVGYNNYVTNTDYKIVNDVMCVDLEPPEAYIESLIDEEAMYLNRKHGFRSGAIINLIQLY